MNPTNPSADVSAQAPTQISYASEVKRKLVHLSSLWMPVAMGLVPPILLHYWPQSQPRWLLCAFFAVLTLGNVGIEYRYARRPDSFFSRVYARFFGRMIRGEVHPGQWIVSGGPYVLAGAFVALLCFPAPIAACGMVVMLTGDTAAALVGRRFGRHKTINGKSIEGVLAFIFFGTLACMVTVWLFGSILPTGTYILVLPAVTLAAMAELYEKQLHIDDNVSIPLVAGGVLSLMFLMG
ncbi:MAG: SEC59/DGK1/VTE5 family protein [Thermoguttaceae bacterium]|nr:SEC59/DGK1/VTE5 family protein [Thermoguttaceae bacterium]